MSTAAINAALVAAAKEMPAVEKAKTVKVTTQKGSFSYSYATLDHLIAKTRPVLQKHGLAIVQFPEVLETGQPCLRTILVHESGEQLHSVAPLFLPRQDMQEFGSAITYARRYAWAAALGIASEEDDDAQSVSKTQAGGQPTPSPRPGKTPAAPIPAAGAGGQSGGGGTEAPAAAPARTAVTDRDDGLFPPIATQELVCIDLGVRGGVKEDVVRASVLKASTQRPSDKDYRAWLARQETTLKKRLETPQFRAPEPKKEAA